MSDDSIWPEHSAAMARYLAAGIAGADKAARDAGKAVIRAVNEISHYIPISAEQHRLMTEGPTEAEIAESKRWIEQREAEELRQRERYEARRQAAVGFERKVLDLHAPVAGGYQRYQCHGCDWGDYAQDAPEWPCSTAELALEES